MKKDPIIRLASLRLTPEKPLEMAQP